MKRLAGWCASWFLFCMGDIVARVLRVVPNEWPTYWLYRAYQFFMCASSDVQDWGGSGPWKMKEQSR